jgi:hypothetical protein
MKHTNGKEFWHICSFNYLVKHQTYKKYILDVK